ncbi:MAG: hypothetical protein KBT39_11455 [Bacteroidales bacterium]|nr:hypothetical protein [Bacteroidales bacterium]
MEFFVKTRLSLQGILSQNAGMLAFLLHKQFNNWHLGHIPSKSLLALSWQNPRFRGILLAESWVCQHLPAFSRHFHSNENRNFLESVSNQWVTNTNATMPAFSTNII